MALAFDNTATASALSGASLSVSMTVAAGANLFVMISSSTNDITVGTYNGVDFLANPILSTGDSTNGFIKTYYLTTPTSGAHTLACSRTTSGTADFAIHAVSYLGGVKSGIPDSSASGQTSAGTSQTVSTTTVADNSWTILCSSATRNVTAGSGTNQRQVFNGSNISMFLGDSNAAITPAGSHNMSYTLGSSVVSNYIIFSIAPNTPVKTMTDSISRGASRAITVARTVINIRALSDSIMRGASRVILVGIGLFRNLSDSIMNGAGRVATLTRNTLWNKLTAHAATWSKASGHAATWTKKARVSTIWSKQNKNP